MKTSELDDEAAMLSSIAAWKAGRASPSTSTPTRSLLGGSPACGDDSGTGSDAGTGSATVERRDFDLCPRARGVVRRDDDIAGSRDAGEQHPGERQQRLDVARDGESVDTGERQRSSIPAVPG